MAKKKKKKKNPVAAKLNAAEPASEPEPEPEPQPAPSTTGEDVAPSPAPGPPPAPPPSPSAYYRRMIGIREAQFGPNDASVSAMLNSLAVILKGEGELAEAAELFDRASRAQAESQGETDPDTLLSRSNLAETLLAIGGKSELERADPILKDVSAKQALVLGTESPFYWLTRSNIGEPARPLSYRQPTPSL